MAWAARRERGLFDPDADPGQSPFDHHVFVLASDGDLMEGVTSEASSLAGHQQLGNLVLIYDENHISIEDDTDISFSEDVGKRVRGLRLARPARRLADTGRLRRGRRRAACAPSRRRRPRPTKPSIIVLNTIIGWPAPTKQNSGKAHGAALGADEVAGTKRVLGFDPEQSFEVSDEVLSHAREVVERGAKLHADWQPGFDKWRRRQHGAGRAARPLAAPGAARRLGRRAPDLRPGPQGDRDPRGQRQGADRPGRECCRSCGAARPTWPRATSRRWRASRRPSRPTGRPRTGPADPTAARCTSASASTPWARSSTASRCSR